MRDSFRFFMGVRILPQMPLTVSPTSLQFPARYDPLHRKLIDFKLKDRFCNLKLIKLCFFDAKISWIFPVKSLKNQRLFVNK